MRTSRREPGSFSEPLFLLVVVVLGLLLRLHLLLANNFVIDSDEAIVGLMAKHIIEGRGIPVFYYGQHYMGSLEALGVSAMFWLFGVSQIALKAVPLIFSIFTIVLVYLLGRECAGRFGAEVAGLLFACGPASLIVWSSMARGGFIEVVFLGALALLLTCRALKLEEISLFSTFVIGLVLGLGWWTNNQILYFMLPIGFFILLRLKQRKRAWLDITLTHFAVGVSGFLLGGLPFWIYNLNFDFASFAIFKGAKGGDVFSHLAGLISLSLPMLFGAKPFWSSSDLFPLATWVVYLIYFVLILALAFRPKHKGDLTPLFIAFCLTCLIVFVLSSFGNLVQAPRYLLPLYVGVFVLVGIALENLSHSNRTLTFVLLVLILAINLHSNYPGFRSHAIPGEPFVYNNERVSKDHRELITWLSKNNIKWVRTNYWIGYRLAFETEEGVKFRVFQEPHQERLARYVKEGLGLDSMPFVLVPSQAKLVRTGLAASGYSFSEAEKSGYVVIHDVRPKFSELTKIKEGITITAYNQSNDVGLVTDGDINTRWGSGEPQHPGMTFSLAFNRPEGAKLLRYDLGTFHHDYPRSLKIEGVNGDGELVSLIESDKFEAVRYLQDRSSEIKLALSNGALREIRLVQNGSHPIFDWSIAELEVFK